MTSWRVFPALACAALLSGCVNVDIGPGDVVITDAVAKRQKLNLSGQPARAAPPPVGPSVEEGALPAGFGDIHYAVTKVGTTKTLIVFCGGNTFREEYGGAARAAALAPFGDTFLFNYPGYAASGGSGKREEFEAARPVIGAKVAALAAERGAKLLFWGHSLGGWYCSALASDAKAPSDLVVEGAFARFTDIADAQAGLASPFVRLRVDPRVPRYDPPTLLANYPGKIVVVASRKDETIPFKATHRLAQRLQAAGRDVTFVELKAGAHSTFYKDAEYRQKVTAALKAKGVGG